MGVSATRDRITTLGPKTPLRPPYNIWVKLVTNTHGAYKKKTPFRLNVLSQQITKMC